MYPKAVRSCGGAALTSSLTAFFSLPFTDIFYIEPVSHLSLMVIMRKYNFAKSG